MEHMNSFVSNVKLLKQDISVPKFTDANDKNYSIFLLHKDVTFVFVS